MSTTINQTRYGLTLASLSVYSRSDVVQMSPRIADQSQKTYSAPLTLPTDPHRRQSSILAVLFASHAQRWRRDTAFVASVTRRSLHASYQKIIAMGMDAVPFILKDLMTNGPDDWFWALSKITGENPITEDIAGDMNKMTEAWLLWARKSGYQVTCRPVKKQDSPDSIQATIE